MKRLVVALFIAGLLASFAASRVEAAGCCVCVTSGGCTDSIADATTCDGTTCVADGGALAFVGGATCVSGCGGAVATPTATLTNTPTETPTSTPTSTPTDTPTPTITNTPTDTPTETPTSTPTDTPTETPTQTPTDTPTDTPTPTDTATPTNTRTNTPTATPTIDDASAKNLIQWRLTCPTESIPCDGRKIKPGGSSPYSVSIVNEFGTASVNLMCKSSAAPLAPEIALATLTGSSCGTAANCTKDFTAQCAELWLRTTACAPAPTPTGTPAPVGESCEVSGWIRQGP